MSQETERLAGIVANAQRGGRVPDWEQFRAAAAFAQDSIERVIGDSP